MQADRNREAAEVRAGNPRGVSTTVPPQTGAAAGESDAGMAVLAAAESELAADGSRDSPREGAEADAAGLPPIVWGSVLVLATVIAVLFLMR